jgi:hypothetical protein
MATLVIAASRVHRGDHHHFMFQFIAETSPDRYNVVINFPFEFCFDGWIMDG